jgi:hypothetical protein
LMFIGRSYGERKTELGKLICIFYARVRRLDFPLKKNTRTYHLSTRYIEFGA